MPALFEAYVTNLGKYNEGALVGEYLKFPTIPEEVQALLKRIGVDGVRYEEIFITDFDGDVLGLYDHLGEYENLDELNHLACLLSELDQSDLEKFEAVIDSGEHTSSVADLINLTQNLDCFEFYSDVHSDEELGRMYVLEFGGVEVPEHLIDYIDYEAYGRDVRINESGHFAPGGYVFDYPGNVLFVPTVMGGIHPTQKPVELCEYFIKTYTDEGAVVADICAGSGTTAVAALNTGRRFICFENAPAIYGPAVQRIEQARLAVERGGKGV